MSKGTIDAVRLCIEPHPLSAALSQGERVRNGLDEIKTSSCRINNGHGDNAAPKHESATSALALNASPASTEDDSQDGKPLKTPSPNRGRGLLVKAVALADSLSPDPSPASGRGEKSEPLRDVPLVTVEALPYGYPFDPARTALVIIDMQRDFIEPGGFGEALGNDVAPLAAIVPVVGELLALARKLGLLVVHTRESHLPDLSDCPPSKLERGNPRCRIGDEGPMGRILIRGEAGNDIVPALRPAAGEIVIDKPGKGAFYNTSLQAILLANGITHLLFCGVTTEVCVQTSMREANDRGYECLLVEDATASYFPQFKEATLAMVRAQGGIVGWTAPLAALTTALARPDVAAAT